MRLGSEGQAVTDKQKKSPAARVLIGLVATLVFATIYTLSMGPMLWLATHGYLSDGTRQILSRAYQPLWVFAGYVPFLKQWLLWYVGLWD